MYLPSHLSAGAIIGLATQNPFVAVLAGLASHFVLDAIPHWQLVQAPYRFSWKSIVTLVGTILATPLLGWYLYSLAPDGNQTAVFVAMICACVFDLDDVLVMIPWIASNKLFQRFRAFHNSIQKETTQIHGLVFQLVPIVVAIVVLSL